MTTAFPNALPVADLDPPPGVIGAAYAGTPGSGGVTMTDMTASPAPSSQEVALAAEDEGYYHESALNATWDRFAAGHRRADVPVRAASCSPTSTCARSTRRAGGRVGFRPPVAVDGHHDHGPGGAERQRALLRAAADQGRAQGGLAGRRAHRARSSAWPRSRCRSTSSRTCRSRRAAPGTPASSSASTRSSWSSSSRC